MVLEYINVNVNIHTTALLEHTFYYIKRTAGSRQQLTGFMSVAMGYGNRHDGYTIEQ